MIRLKVNHANLLKSNHLNINHLIQKKNHKNPHKTRKKPLQNIKFPLKNCKEIKDFLEASVLISKKPNLILIPKKKK